MAVCHYHPDRTAIGLCVRCRRSICPACSTKLNGVNHCHACLNALGVDSGKKAEGFLTPSLLGAVAVWCTVVLGVFGLGLLVQGLLAPTFR